MKTKSGRNARIICRDRKGFGGRLPVLALVEDDGGNELGVPYEESLKLKSNINFPGEDMDLVED